MRFSQKHLLIIPGACFLGLPFLGGKDISDTREALKEWVRIESQISSEVSRWNVEKEILLDQIALLEEEKERLTARIEEARTGLGEVTQRRAALTEERDRIKAVTEGMQEPLVLLEERVRVIYQQFPEPLREETSRLYGRIPEDPGKTSLSVAQRLQAVVGLLNFADKFNTGVQREVEIRSIDGRQMEVETLYFGLAGAFFSDAGGRHAGIGMPGTDGWTWTETPDHADSIARLIAVYNGTREAEFNLVPVEIAQ